MRGGEEEKLNEIKNKSTTTTKKEEDDAAVTTDPSNEYFLRDLFQSAIANQMEYTGDGFDTLMTRYLYRKYGTETGAIIDEIVSCTRSLQYISNILQTLIHHPDNSQCENRHSPMTIFQREKTNCYSQLDIAKAHMKHLFEIIDPAR